MRAVIVGAGMGGLMTALALRQSGVFASVDVYEQTKVPSTAGAGLNIPPNGARISRWLGVDLDGGDPRGPDGAIDGGRAAILESTRQFNTDGIMTKRPFDHVTAAGDGAGFHHMHRLDLLMCLYKRVFEFGPDSGALCPITVHMDCRLTQLRQTAGEVTASQISALASAAASSKDCAAPWPKVGSIGCAASPSRQIQPCTQVSSASRS